MKQEPKTSTQINTKQQQQLNSVNWQDEKQALVQKIVSLKSESHQSLLALKKVQAERDVMFAENKKMSQKMNQEKDASATKIKDLQNQLSKAKTDYFDLKADNEKIMSDLKRKNQFLLARQKQLQTGVQQNPTDSVYEVEAILNHKDTKNGRSYLIRWEGYGSDDDTWEKAENLKCPTLLTNYIRSIKSNQK